MTRLIALSVAIALSGTAVAQSSTRIFHDSAGRVTGRARNDRNGVTTFHDAAGRVTGKARTENGTTRHYDAAGRAVGKVREPR
jgi:YD repeat-containing protein